MKSFLPNLITLLNLLCGCIAALYAFQDDLLMAGIFVGAGIFFDFFDGLVARTLRVSSPLGTQLDSLADMVTSGLVPGIAMFQMLKDAVGLNVWDQDDRIFIIDEPTAWLALLGFLITLGSCYRLAKFNIDDRQTDSFIGVPTPANAIFIISLGILAQQTQITWLFETLTNPYILLGLTLFSTYILNAELPLFALKFKNWGLAGNKIRYAFICISIVLIATLKIYAIPCVILIYILMSLIYQWLRKPSQKV
ncbi:CDP-alcohol phosphatidyltransferase family protein [Nonlabens xiamenensis]|uniref:CDP-alcohol phosphatidyltransferase family protein n=1 Tax=Nonlabens xiamenensis TaxID=2341043 RepID=UPI000F60EA84|nr:CDP-alcohol phosphatidyltransferase family protein [Nonlabens xiamenensis]